MERRKQRRQILWCVTASVLLLLSPGCAPEAGQVSAADRMQAVADLSGGYFAAEYLGDAFLAAGAGGRIDRISKGGQAGRLEVPTGENLLDVFYQDGIALVCGENGTLLYSTDGQTFERAKVKEKGDIRQIAAFGGRFYACAEDGRVLVSEDGHSWSSQETGTGNDLIGIAANEHCVMAVTEGTDLLTSTDGQTWKIINFNESYDGYYDRRSFTGLCDLGDALFIYGQMEDNPGEPYLMFTEEADVWFFKALTSVNGEDFASCLPLAIRSVGLVGDQLVAVCDGGRLLTITDCQVCHRMSESEGEDWNDIAMGDGMVLLVGRDFKFECIDETELRQSAISAEQALADIENGAAVVDVRTAEERETEGYIPGSIHVPVDDLAEQLPVLVPELDREIIFYCAVGGRAQTALEQAQSMGYSTVYNLGGLSDWPYEIAGRDIAS